MFSEKLNFIMSLTRVQASALAKACSLDPSYVSRMRNGSRPLPKNPGFYDEMVGYLARHITTDYQKAAVCDTMKINAFPADIDRAANLLGKWMTAEDEEPLDISALLASFTGAKPDHVPVPENAQLPGIKSYYFGVEGKREAVLQFFDMILKEDKPRTLLLFSEEDISWMYEDPAFSARWTADFTKVLTAGNRVKIIHNIGRNMNEMLEAIAKWIPVYTTGMIEPYYYPKLRDGIFQRTLFIAPETAAVVSSSVDRRSDGMLNWLVTDKTAVAALAGEFGNYLSLCKPLMNIITAERRDELWKAYSVLAAEEGDMICMSDMPTIATMPERVAEKMQERAPESRILEVWGMVNKSLKQSDGRRYTEILAPLDENRENVPLPCADMLGADGLCYTGEEWRAHIENVRGLAASGSQHITDGIPANICLIAKEGRGIIMTKSNSPGTAFAFSDANMTGLFMDHLNRLILK